MKKRIVFSLFIVLTLIGMTLPTTSLPVMAGDPPHLEVNKNISPDSAVVGEPVTVTLTVTGAGDPLETRVPVDVMLIIDRSLSMGLGGNLPAAKAAAKAFVDTLDSSQDQVGLVSLSSSASLAVGLTNDFARVRSRIDALFPSGYTNIGHAIHVASDELTTNGRSNAVLVEVLLTDGVPNRPGIGGDFNESAAQYARDKAQQGHNVDITLYTIGLSSGVSPYFLDDKPASEHTYNPSDPAGHPYNGAGQDGLAYIGAGEYYFAPSGSDLQLIFNDISKQITNTAGTDIMVTEVLPNGVNYELDPAPNPAPANVSPDGQTLTWNLDPISIGNTVTITFTVTYGNPGHQLVETYPDSKVTYTDYLGNPDQEAFPETYITVNSVNAPPVAENNNYSVDEGGTLTADDANGTVGDASDNGVLANDTDTDGDSLTAILVSDASNGTLSLDSDGTFSYTHDGSETTSDSFTYKANDGTADSNTATVSITVTPVNDNAPVAVNDSATVAEGGTHRWLLMTVPLWLKVGQ